MSDDLSRYITSNYVTKLFKSKPGTKVISLTNTRPFVKGREYTIGGRYHSTVDGYTGTTWIGIIVNGRHEGVRIGFTYAFKLVNDNDYIAYDAKNKPNGDT